MVAALGGVFFLKSQASWALVGFRQQRCSAMVHRGEAGGLASYLEMAGEAQDASR